MPLRKKREPQIVNICNIHISRVSRVTQIDGTIQEEISMRDHDHGGHGMHT